MNLYKYDHFNESTKTIAEGEAVLDAYVVADTAPTNYTDVSSIDNWASHGEPLIGSVVGFMDWKCLRSEIKTLANSICLNDIQANWDSLSSTEKQICCQYLTNLVAPADFIATYPTAAERTKISLSFDEKSIEARKQRYMIMRSYTLGKLGSTNGVKFLDDAFRDGGRVVAYVAGIETKAGDGVDGLLDMVDGTAGTSYASGASAELLGLRHRGYAVTDGSGDSLDDVCDGIISISNGVY